MRKGGGRCAANWNCAPTPTLERPAHSRRIFSQGETPSNQHASYLGSCTLSYPVLATPALFREALLTQEHVHQQSKTSVRGTTVIHGLRACFLLLAICALGTLALWRYGSHWVGRFDLWVRAEYPARHLDSVDQAKELLAVDVGRGIPALELALQEFPKVHKGDWLFAPKQKALLELALTYQKQEQWDRAIETAATAYRNDDKNIRARRLWIQCILSSASTTDEGFRELGKLVHDFPGIVSSARQFVEMAFERGDLRAAGEAGIRHFLSTSSGEGGQLPKGSWLGWWTNQENAAGFGSDRRTNASVQLVDRRISIEFQVPRGQSAIRLDLPPGSELGLEIESMQALPLDGASMQNLMDSKRRSHHLTLSGNRLESAGNNDPWISIELPAKLAGSGFLFRMVCRTDEAPEWLSQTLLQPNALEETYLLGERGRIRPTKVIREIQFQNWLRDGLQYEWRGMPELAPLRADPNVAGRYHFRVNLEVPADGAEWALPSALCYRWQVGGVAVMWSEKRGTHTRTCTSMSQDSPGVWTSVWTDSDYRLWLQGPEGDDSVSVVTLGGWIQ